MHDPPAAPPPSHRVHHLPPFLLRCANQSGPHQPCRSQLGLPEEAESSQGVLQNECQHVKGWAALSYPASFGQSTGKFNRNKFSKDRFSNVFLQKNFPGNGQTWWKMVLWGLFVAMNFFFKPWPDLVPVWLDGSGDRLNKKTLSHRRVFQGKRAIFVSSIPAKICRHPFQRSSLR